jgi:hypothetical protein
MDLYRIIHDLFHEKTRLDSIISSLEVLATQDPIVNTDGPAVRRRGRKPMLVEERRQVSDRMKKYWTNRRPQDAAGQLSQSPAAGNARGIGCADRRENPL